MKALIDGDIFAYEFGAATDDQYHPLSWPLVQARVQSRISGILEATNADDYQIYLTSEDKSNFRIDLATIKPYKGHRPSEKPHHYERIREFLIKHRGAIEVHGMEADDALSIEQWKNLLETSTPDPNNNAGINGRYLDDRLANTVICSRDKDLDMVPGYHYSWSAGKQKEKEMWWQDEIGGLRCFYSQLLTGDSTDNIPGLYGVGKSSKLLSQLLDMGDELSMYEHVLNQYELRFGSYAEQFLIENARLLWMLREEGEMWLPPDLNIDTEDKQWEFQDGKKTDVV